MKPIIFTGVRSGQVHRGEKTMTRRVMKPQPNPETRNMEQAIFSEYWVQLDGYVDRCGRDYTGEPIKAPYQVGDLLWVKETWCEAVKSHQPPRCFYKADTAIEGEEIRQEYIKAGYLYKWQSPLFMPRWASRTTLEVTEVRAERLQQISEADALAEGVGKHDGSVRVGNTHRAEFACTWNEVHRKHPENQWEANPWVWVIAFKRVSE